MMEIGQAGDDWSRWICRGSHICILTLYTVFRDDLTNAIIFVVVDILTFF